MIGKFMKRGSGSETRGATDIQLDSGDQPIPATEADGARFFDPADVKKEVSSAHNDLSRETIIYMSPDEFLSLAKKEPGYDFDLTEVRGLIEEGTPFSSMPSLSFDHDGKGMAKVVGHEGRHRMLALKELGVESVPVKFNSRERGEGRALRWGQQANPESRDYVPPSERPVQITSEDGDVVLPMFDSTIYPADLRPRATVFDVETGVTSPLEKTVGEPRTSGLPGGVNPAVRKMREIPGAETVTDSLDYSPIENALRNAEEAMGASPTKGLTGEQYLARLPKVQSVSKAELEASGLESFLRQPENIRRKIPAQELLDVAKSRLPKIKSYTLNHRSEGNRTAPEHMFDQRLLRNPDEEEANDLIVDYFETVLYNENATDITPLDFEHFNNRGGEFAHARGSIINDPRAPGRQSTFIEEGQGDIVDAIVKKEGYPKQIKQAEEKIDRLRKEQADPDEIARQEMQLTYLQGASQAYEKAMPLTPQLRDTFDQAFEKMQADPQFKTLPDLQKRRADAVQRRGAAATEAREAARMLPGRKGDRDIDETIWRRFSFDDPTNTLFNQMNNARHRQNNPGSSPRLADIEIAQALDNRLGGLGFNFFPWYRRFESRKPNSKRGPKKGDR